MYVHSTWDPDPETASQRVVIKKDGKLVGLQAKDSKGPQFYPTIEKIARGTPVFNCPDIQLGDQLKTINGVFLRGKSKDFVHATVRAIPAGSEIDFQIIKTFKEKGFRGSVKGGLRINSVRRTNPLMAMEAQMGAMDEMNAIGEDEEGDATAENAPPPRPPKAGGFVEKTGGFKKKASVYGGFGGGNDDDGSADAPAAGGFVEKKGGFKARKASVYGGFGGGDGDDDGAGDGAGGAIAEGEEDDGFGGDDDFGGFGDDFNFETLDITEEDPWS
eukprot:gene18510-32174_t